MSKKKLEVDIQREICDWLAEREYFFWRQNTIPVFEKGHFRAMPKYSRKGLPDIMMIHEGKFIGIEVKKPGYWKRTDDQIKAMDDITDHGGFYHLVTSLDEVKEIMLYYDRRFVPVMESVIKRSDPSTTINEVVDETSKRLQA